MNKKSNRLHSSQKNAMLRARNREQIRSYFEQVLNLRNSGEAYPVKLDDVWPLVYGRKDDAVEVLKREFYSELDYIVKTPDYQRLRQKSGNLDSLQGTGNQGSVRNPLKVGGDFRSKTYFLTAACLEYFIARRVPEVFEVYRKIFHLNVEANTPIAGVFPVLYQGKVYYPYNQLLRAIGYSGRSGSVQKRKRQYPGCFIKVFGINFITPSFVEMLTKQRELLVIQQEMKLKQLELQFKEA